MFRLKKFRLKKLLTVSQRKITADVLKVVVTASAQNDSKYWNIFIK